VTFAPTAAQAYSGSLSFSRANGSQISVTLSGIGSPPVMQAPKITSQPLSQTVIAGTSAKFNVAAAGTAPMAYQWRMNGAPVSGATSSSYTTPAQATSNNNAQFSVAVSNGAGSATSNAAVLTVSAPTVAPAITTQPLSRTIVAGTSATFNVTATGTAPMTYQWRVNGAPISGATLSSYTTPAETTSNTNAQFTVAVTNSVGSTISNAAVLTVSAAAVAPTITTQPLSRTTVAGTSATFNVTASGTAPMTYQWRMNGTPISGATSSSYTTPAETTSNTNAQFTVAVTNSVGSVTSNAAVLTVSAAAVAPTITTQPLSQTIVAGASATFNVAATGIAPMTYQWRMNGTPVSGATLSSYTTPAETTSNTNAQFTVAVTNSVGSATSNAAVLTVSAPAVAPAITTQPLSQTIVAGASATFNVAATGTAPMTYQWKMNGTPISGATLSSYTTPAETTSNTNAQFTVAVTNSVSSATSNPAVLTVTSASVAPTVTTQPASQTVIAGKTATFSVVATGTAPITYQWRMNGTPISGATSSSYTTPGETTSNTNAQFTAAVTNSAGSTTSNAAILTVNAATLTLNSSATSLNFGSVNVSSSGSQNVTLTNAGNSSVSISNVSVLGAGFNANGVSSGLILNPGQSATMTATFSPSASGSMTGSVTVASTATNSPDTIALSGTGMATVNHSASLSWVASTSSVIGYNAYSSKVSGGPYTKLNSTPVASTAYTDSTVQAGLTYYYVVTSVATGNVESANSSEVSAIIP